MSGLQLTPPKATDIKRIGKQPQDAPCTKGDIRMVLDHLHRVVKLDKNETRPIPRNHPSGSEVLVKSECPVASLKVRFFTNPRDYKTEKRGRQSK